jgi:hypothetical protein
MFFIKIFSCGANPLFFIVYIGIVRAGKLTLEKHMDSGIIDPREEYLALKMQEAAPMIALDAYLHELAVQVAHSPFVQVSVTEVVDRLLDVRNLMPDVVIDGDEMTIMANKNK